MVAKVFLVAFLAVFALQVPADAASTVPTRAEMKDIIDEVINGLQIFWDWAKKNLVALLDKVIQLGQQAIEAGKQKLQELIEYLKTQIAALVEQAQAVSADVTECVQGVEENANDLYNKAIAEVQGCLEGPKKKIEELINVALAKLDEIFDKIEEIKKKFIDCDDGWICIAGVATEAIGVASSIPGEVTPILEQAQDAAGAIIAEVPTCVAGKGAELKEHLDVILNTVTTCIKGKLPTPPPE